MTEREREREREEEERERERDTQRENSVILFYSIFFNKIWLLLL